MEFSLRSFLTISYWRYALLTTDSFKSALAFLGGVWGLIELFDYFKVIEREHYTKFSLGILFILTLIFVIVTRRPLYKIKFKVPGQDTTIHVRIGDMFKIEGQKIISTNTTFDTDIANGIIAVDSVQGQFTTKFFPQSIQALDNELDNTLQNIPSTAFPKPGKTRKYPIGTTVRINQGNEKFYLVAMADMNAQNTASTTMNKLSKSLDELWDFMVAHGEMEDIVLPLIGSKRGRLKIKRKALIVRLIHSFIEAYSQQPFCKDLIIVIHPTDMDQYDLNLFEIRDLMVKAFS